MKSQWVSGRVTNRVSSVDDIQISCLLLPVFFYKTSSLRLVSDSRSTTIYGFQRKGRVSHFYRFLILILEFKKMKVVLLCLLIFTDLCRRTVRLISVTGPIQTLHEKHQVKFIRRLPNQFPVQLRIVVL